MAGRVGRQQKGRLPPKERKESKRWKRPEPSGIVADVIALAIRIDSKLPGRRAGCSGKRPLPPTATCSKSLGSPRPAMRRGSNLLGKEILGRVAGPARTPAPP